MPPIPRVGARLLLVDPDDRVVLVEVRLDGAGPATAWRLPGGGAEPGESPAQAAVREARAQTGLAVAVDDLSDLDTCRWSSTDVERGVQYDEMEHLYLARVAAHPVTPLIAAERPDVVGARWWTLDELRAADARLEPPDLADVLGRALATPRVAGRVLLLDENDRVLLVENTVDVGASATHWITPGGGTDPGETPAQAAVREAYEELGVRIELPAGAEPDYADHEVFTFNGRWYDQTNYYWVVRLAPGTPLVAQGVDDVERSVLIGERWWTLDELRASDAVIYPVGLADVLARLLCAEQASPA